MIKCNVTVCGTVSKAATCRTNKEGKAFVSFAMNVVIPAKSGINKTIEVSVIKDGTLHGCGGTVRPHQARYLRLGRVCTRGTGGRTDGCADRSAIWHDEALEGRFGCLSKVLAGFAERVAAVHLDHVARCEESHLDAHAAYRQDCDGDRPGEKG